MSEVAADRAYTPLRVWFLVVLWGLFAIWMVLSLTGNLLPSGGPPASRHLSEYGDVWIALDFWSLGATLIVGFVAYNPLAWRNGKRLIVGSMAFAMMLGRLFSGLALHLLESTPLQLPEGLVALLIPFILWFDGILVIGIVASIIGAIFAFFIAVPVVLFNQILQFENAIHVYRYHERGLASRIVRAVYWLRNQPLPEAEPNDRVGARFATKAEAAAIHNATKGNPARMGFGHWTGSTDTPFYVATDKHVLVMASTRSGKGVALIVPHLLRYQGSAFVLDPKGENAKATGRQRAGAVQPRRFRDCGLLVEIHRRPHRRELRSSGRHLRTEQRAERQRENAAPALDRPADDGFRGRPHAGPGPGRPADRHRSRALLSGSDPRGSVGQSAKAGETRSRGSARLRAADGAGRSCSERRRAAAVSLIPLLERRFSAAEARAERRDPAAACILKRSIRSRRFS